jgi:hypothetical protein
MRQYSFSIIRYVPDMVREEFINIGVLICDLSGARPPMVRLTRNWTRLRSLAPDADVETLQALEQDLNLYSAQMSGADSLMNSIQDSFSSNLQLGPSRGRAAESMDRLAEDLMTLYVHPPLSKTLFAVVGGN